VTCTHNLLGYANDVKLLVENINIIEKNTEALLYASKEAGLEVNAEKKYKAKSRHQTTRQYHYANNKSFENHNFIHVKI
jgi:hypothetical protein